MPNPIAKPQPETGDTAMVQVVPNSFGMVLPGSDWWVNEPVWDQAVRRLTAPPLPPRGMTGQITLHEDAVKRN